MAYPLINGAAINAQAQGDDGSTKGISMVLSLGASAVMTQWVQGRDAFAIGTPKAVSGSDTDLAPWGIGMAVAGTHQVFVAQPPASVVLSVQGQRAMRLGTPSVAGSTSVRAAGTGALRIGQPGRTDGARAAGAGALTLGSPSLSTLANAAGRGAMVFGTAQSGLGLTVLNGIPMAVAGRAAAIQGVVVCEAADGVQALALGATRSLGYTARARQSLALELGRPRVERTHQC
ncbi:hypothetical protein [Comamonas testosteroni]|uniref:hypothetical protein n=1 Tax=Comamonas testosteroni TaxID=285 RepID=UPI0005B32083|nr:hypothetical protein [Comamonas testosteroni]